MAPEMWSTWCTWCGVPPHPKLIAKCPTVICSIVLEGWDITLAACNQAYRGNGDMQHCVSRCRISQQPLAAVICNTVYGVWDITKALETMSSWATVIGNMVYNVWDIIAAPEMISKLPSVICNMVYKVWNIKNQVHMGSGDINTVCEVWDISARA